VYDGEPAGRPAELKKEILMRRTFIPLAVVAWVVASIAGAELSQTYTQWPEGPVGFLLTQSEQKAYSQLQTDAEAKAFIDLFWARRDPDLKTVQNEFKVDFDMRVAAADAQFSTSKLKGSLSDRGKVLYLMGKPEAVRNVAAGAAQQGNLPEFVERGASQIWIYTKDGKPLTDQTKKGDQIIFVFAETSPGAGDFVLDPLDRRNRQAFKLLAAKPEELLLHPKLTEVPKVGLVPGTEAATPAQEAVFDQQPRPWPQGAVVLATSGVESETIHPVWVWVQLPNNVPAASKVIGRVRKAGGGESVGSFVSPIMAVSVPGGRGYEVSLPVEAGSWKVDLALLNESEPIAVTTVDAKNDAAPAQGPYISPIYWGANARQAAQAHMGDAYHLGGMELIPQPDNKYTPNENITYAGYVVRPSLDEEQKPKIELSIALFAAGKKQDEQPFQVIDGVRITDDIWVFGQMLPLATFRRDVEFEIRVTFRDAKTGVSREARIPFTVMKEPEPTPVGTSAAGPGATPTK
jgi:GWxTD domain-containing protein